MTYTHRYNLLSGRILGKWGAYGFAVVLPWIFTAFCYNASVLADVCAWAGILVMGFANFVVPAMCYRAGLQQASGEKQPLLSEAAGGHAPHELSASVTGHTSLSWRARQEEENAHNPLDLDKALYDPEDALPHSSSELIPEEQPDQDWIQVLPDCVTARIKPENFALGIAVAFSIVSCGIIASNLYFAITGQGVGQ